MKYSPDILWAQIIISAMLVCYGLGMLIWPNAYSSTAYHVAFDFAAAMPLAIAPVYKWGIAFLGVGLTSLFIPNRFTAAATTFWLFLWTSFMVGASITGLANGPGFVVWLSLSLIYGSSVWRFGTKPLFRRGS